MPELTEESLEDFYRTLKRYQQRVHADQRLPAPPADSVSVRSRLCGSALTLDAVIADGRVQQLGWSVHACALGQAASTLVGAEIIGKTPAELAVAVALQEGAAPDAAALAARLAHPEGGPEAIAHARAGIEDVLTRRLYAWRLMGLA